MNQIEAVIFDWAGTTVDYGCMAPILAMNNAFATFNLAVTLAEIREPMGMLKVDHIRAILNMPRIQALFHQLHGRSYTDNDVMQLYENFEREIFTSLHDHTQIIDGVLKTQEYLRSQNIKIGSTTGYTKPMIDIVATSAAQQGYLPDYILSADLVSHGRPYPYMIHQNLQALSVSAVSRAVKVGDTIVDIQEGKCAGCWSVGVILGSSLLGLNQSEVNALSITELRSRCKRVQYEFLAAGADYVIESIDELPYVLQLIEYRLQKNVSNGVFAHA